MSWQDALEIEVARSGVERYRWLCSEDNPDIVTREGYRAFMIRRAIGTPEPAPAVSQAPSPEDAALQTYLVRHGCCGG